MKLKTLAIACITCISLQADLYFSKEMISTHLKTYTEKEINLIEKDLDIVRSICFESSDDSAPLFYLATAGAPGSRKTTILEKFIQSHPEYQSAVYLDPDPRTLRFMAHTYYAQSLNSLEISKKRDYSEVIKTAYNKWRPGSNYISLTLLEEAAVDRRSIIYGTTSTGAHIPEFFAKLKENNYQIVLLLSSCSDALRYEAVDYRNEEIRFYQSSPEDAVSKGKFFPERMSAYFTYADLMYLYWSDDLFAPERLAAIWKEGKMEVKDTEAMDRFIEKYEADRTALAAEGKLIPAFTTYYKKSRRRS